MEMLRAGVEGCRERAVAFASVVVDRVLGGNVEENAGIAIWLGAWTLSCRATLGPRLAFGVSTDSVKLAPSSCFGVSTGSGSISIFFWLQCGHFHSRDNAASRLRSCGGAFNEPTPSAFDPLTGKKPCSPIMAVRIPHAGCHSSS